MSLLIDSVMQKLGIYAEELKVNRPDAVALTFEAVRDVGLYNDMVEKVEWFDVTSAQICLPANVIRVRSVSLGCDQCDDLANVYQTSSFIRFNGGCPDGVDRVRVHYLAMPVDTDGEPMAAETFDEVAMWWIIRAKFTSGWLAGNIPNDRMDRIKAELFQAKRKYRSSFRNVSQDEMEGLADMLHSPVIPYSLPR